jgi:hypothetical protein
VTRYERDRGAQPEDAETQPGDREDDLDDALAATFPASDPVAAETPER